MHHHIVIAGVFLLFFFPLKKSLFFFLLNAASLRGSKCFGSDGLTSLALLWGRAKDLTTLTLALSDSHALPLLSASTDAVLAQ